MNERSAATRPRWRVPIVRHVTGSTTADVVVIGAGIVGAACAYYLSQAGLSVVIADQYGVAAGTTGSGEGNILVSDKAPGAELDLALLSNRLWRELADDLESMELEAKGGLVVAWTDEAFAGLETFARQQRAVGVDAASVMQDDLGGHEPHLSQALVGGVVYPQDMQVQPMLAAARLVARAVEFGAVTRLGAAVRSVRVDPAGVAAVEIGDEMTATRHVVNAAGLGAAEVAAMVNVKLPILPRRGVIVVTEPLPQTVRHKVYSADYVANVSSDSAGLETSTVVESTRSGTILIGASRERVGLDRTLSLPVVGTLVRQAIAMFPFLSGVHALRTYQGFRPYCPDHLPVVGPDPRVPGLLHACGHEGAGVGLAPATGRLIAEVVLGRPASLQLDDFRPDRFELDDE
jgi:D-hydroxyproline dehydrogenase subunit beta